MSSPAPQPSGAPVTRLPAPVAPLCPDSGVPAGSAGGSGLPSSPRVLHGLSVVLPCWNDEATVADAIRAAAAAAASTSHDYEIVVVDDGSTDATATIAAGFAAADRRVRLVMHARTRGYGEALRSGICAAGLPWVLLADASREVDLMQLGDLVPFADSFDLLLGWRMLRRDPARRRAGAAVRAALVRLLLGVRIRDVDCALKLVRRDLFEPMELESSGPAIGVELVSRALAAGARVTELGVHQRDPLPGEHPGHRSARPAQAFRELLRVRRGVGRLHAALLPAR